MRLARVLCRTPKMDHLAGLARERASYDASPSQRISPSKARSRIGWISELDIDRHPQSARKTSIICTIGPRTNSVDMMVSLRKAGMNIVRLNFSHGSHEYHASAVKNARDSFAVMAGRPLAIALDTKGPEIRTGDMESANGLCIPEGHVFLLTADPKFKESGNLEAVYMDYDKIDQTLQAGSLVYVDDGNLQLEVLETLPRAVRVRARNAHCLLSHKGVNLPYAKVDLPAISDKDRQDLQFAAEHGLDMVFASFIRSPEDIRTIRSVLGERGKDIVVIAKIENHEGVRNFDAILAEADGIMVARGDLGIEIPPEKVFVAQKMMIARSNLAGKPVICATQMLESMKSNPRPTRAEASDVANAVLDGADCVMLSAETASGLYPIEAVEIMSKVCVEAEGTIAYMPLFEELRTLISNDGDSVTETISTSAVNASLESYIKAIVVLTRTGDSASRIAKFRPQVPILAITRDAALARRLHLHRGIYPLYYPHPHLGSGNWQQDVEARLEWAVEEGKRDGLLKTGQYVVMIQGSRKGQGYTNAMKILPIP